MPPAAARQSPRVVNGRNREGSAGPGLLKPRLPQLAGTPSARRQYTYGAPMEPPPSRGTQRLSGAVDLSNAVGNVLNEQRRAESAELDQRRSTRQRSRALQEEEDELVGQGYQDDSSKQQQQQQQQNQEPRNLASFIDTGVSEANSFGTASSVFGDATIEESPAPPVRPPTKSAPKVQPSSLRHVTEAEHSDSSDELSVPSKSRASPARTRRKAEAQPTTRRVTRSSRQNTVELSDDDTTPQPERMTTRSKATSETRVINGGSLPSRTGRQASQERDLNHFNTFPKAAAPDVSTLVEEDDEGDFGPPSESSSESAEEASPPSVDHIEHETVTAQADEQARRGSTVLTWMGKPAKLISGLTPNSIRFRGLPTPETQQEPSEDGSESSDDHPLPQTRQDEPSSLRILHPTVWFEVITNLFDAGMERLLSGYNSFTVAARKVDWQNGLKTFSLMFLCIAVLLAPLLAPWGSVSEWSSNWSASRSSVWDAPHRVGGFFRGIPLPSFSWGSGRNDLWKIDLENIDDLPKTLETITAHLQEQSASGKLQKESLEKLESLLPKVIHMELKDGKPVVSQDFWFALRDAIIKDSVMMTLKEDDYSQLGSDQQLRAIANGLTSDSAFSTHISDIAHALADASTDRLEAKQKNQLDQWSRANQFKIQDLQDRVEELARRGIKSPTDKDEKATLVSRDEFMRHIKTEFSTNRAQINAEMDEIRREGQAQVKNLLSRIDAINQQKPNTLTKNDVAAIIKEIVPRLVGDMKLEALAQGKIYANWESELDNHINWFNPMYAVTNPKLSSSTWDPYKRGVKKSYTPGLKGTMPPDIALHPWEHDGECWCAARQLNRRRNPHGAHLAVMLAEPVVPTHLVLEHILPGATTDPGSRPKLVEVYAEIADDDVRQNVRYFSHKFFPADERSSWDAERVDLPDAYVKIGETTYEGAEHHGGVHIYRLSDELVALRAETDSVVVRAVTNYGAEKHTCFYRLRLFGHRLGKD